MPIRVLQNSIIKHIENCPGTSLESHLSLIKNKKISKEVIFNLDKGIIQTPKAHIQSRKIELHEPFLSYIWTFCYSFLVISDCSALQEESVGHYKILNQNSPLVRRTLDLLFWAISLKEQYSDWPLELANPEKYMKKEKLFVEKANSIFLDAISFFFYHEYSHLTLGHDEGILSIKAKQNLSNDDRVYLITLEKEADSNAIDLLIGTEPTELHIMRTGYAVMIAMCSTLFLLNKAHNLSSGTHPDHDIRIINAYSKFNISTDRYKVQLQSVITISFNMFAQFYKLKPTNNFDLEIEEMIDYYLYEFSKEKQP